MAARWLTVPTRVIPVFAVSAVAIMGAAAGRAFAPADACLIHRRLEERG